MSVLVFLGWWFGLSFVAGVGLGRLVGRAGMATLPVPVQPAALLVPARGGDEVTGYRAVR